MRQIVSGWMMSARGDGAAPGAEGIYQDMADEQMTKSLVEGGTFGLAGTLYGSAAHDARRDRAGDRRRHGADPADAAAPSPAERRHESGARAADRGPARPRPTRSSRRST